MYSLFIDSSRWIFRRDPLLNEEFIAYDVYTGDKYQLSSTSFLIALLLREVPLSAEQLKTVLRSLGLNLDSELHSFLDLAERIELILKLPPEPIPDNLREIADKLRDELNPPLPERADPKVPVASSPRTIEIHLTHQCNMRCLHCVYDAGKHSDQLPPEDWISFLGQLIDLKVTKVIFSGGEPFLYKGFKDVLKYLEGKRIRVEILTNGTLITDELMDILKSPNFSVVVSLDGTTPEVHHILRLWGYDIVISTIERLSSKGVEFHITSVVHKGNLDEINNLVELALKHGARSINFLALDPLGRAKSLPHLVLSRDDIKQLSLKIANLKEIYGKYIHIGFLDPLQPSYKDGSEIDPGSEVIYCSAGTTRITARWDGKLFPCTYAFSGEEFALGTIYENLGEIWLSDRLNLFRGEVKLKDLKECFTCPARNVCSLKVCRLRPYYDKGDFFGTPAGCEVIKSSLTYAGPYAG